MILFDKKAPSYFLIEKNEENEELLATKLMFYSMLRFCASKKQRLVVKEPFNQQRLVVKDGCWRASKKQRLVVKELLRNV